MNPTDALPLFGNILASGQWPFWSFLGNRICFHTFADCVSIRFKMSIPLVHGSLPPAKQTLQQPAKYGPISNFATGFQKFHLSWEESILQLYIFIWNMKSKVLDSQQWWSSIIVINLCSCNGLLASEGPDRRVYASEFELLNKLWWWSYIVNVRHIWWMSVMFDRRHILWISIITEYDGCPSCMTYGCQSYMYDGCPSYLMFYSHKFPSYMWTSSVMEAMESLSRRNELKRYGEFWSTYVIDGIGRERM